MKFFQSLHLKNGVMEVLGKEHNVRLNATTIVSDPPPHQLLAPPTQSLFLCPSKQAEDPTKHQLELEAEEDSGIPMIRGLGKSLHQTSQGVYQSA